MTMLNAIGKHIAPWRFLMFLAALTAGCVVAVPLLGWSEGVMTAFDVAAIVFIASTLSIFGYDASRMRDIARQNNANRVLLLVISFLLTAVILAAVIAELGQRELGLIDKMLVVGSLVLVWIFANAVYALHYTHLFYTSDDGGKDCAGLDFPETPLPLLSDFVYFAYTLGVAVATSDVVVTSPHIRKVVAAHCVAGFFFNLGVLALTINVLAAG